SNPRRLPMSPEVEAILLRVRGLADGPGPFPISYKTLHPHYMAAVDRVCFALGLGATVRKEWCIHTLRHSCLTMLAAAGASGPQIMQWAGHKSLSMTQRYVHGSAIDLTAVSQLRSTTPTESVAPVKPFPARDLAL
ncbi:MAG: tyrosine-type recombinase/integrase, partial [Synechococcus sp.]